MLECQIRERAYFIWKAKGCPEGQEHQNWVAAERELQVACEHAPSAKPADARTPSPARNAAPKAKAAKNNRKGRRDDLASGSTAAL